MKRPHDGGPCPVPGDTLVRVWHDALNAEACGFAHEWHWLSVTHYEVLIPQEEAQAEIDAARDDAKIANAAVEHHAAEICMLQTRVDEWRDAYKILREQLDKPLQSRRDMFICAAMNAPLRELRRISVVEYADAVMAEADRERI